MLKRDIGDFMLKRNPTPGKLQYASTVKSVLI